MASRTPSRGRSGGRSSSSSGSNPMPMVLGGLGVAVVVVLLLVMNRGGGGKESTTMETPAPQKVAEPAKTAGAVPVTLAAAKAGKTPAKAAPSLTAETLQQVNTLLAEAKKHCNEGVKARTAGENKEARSQQSAAKDKIDAIKRLVATQLLWQEEAQLEDWAQPAEYMTLEKVYGEVSKLEKQVRMSGGT